MTDISEHYNLRETDDFVLKWLMQPVQYESISMTKCVTHRSAGEGRASAT